MKVRFLKKSLAWCCLLLLFIISCKKPETWDAEAYNEWYSGGQQTIWDQSAGAFSSMFPVISNRNALIHEVGDKAFEATFVSSGNLNPGLGPLFNSVACTSCHINDGRGTPIGPGTQMVSLLFRMSIPGEDPHGGPLGVPGFGGQLQQNAIFGAQPEAEVEINYSEQSASYADGTNYSLRVPNYSVVNAYAPLPGDVMFSPRIAPPVFGLGLLEAVNENTILEYEDESDADGDGISGKANYVWDVLASKNKIGRFGWKCGQPTVLQQSAGAYNEDMGITSFLFPIESTHGQTQHIDAVPEPEISDSLLYAVADYVRTLAVPARRNADDPQVKYGKQLFHDANCSSCHRPMMQTGVDVSFQEVSAQYIFPYTDLLLHDMGPDLADFRPDHRANGYEWRTPPLWGIGLTDIVNGHANFLHDGRARNLEEAILWHGGEAQQSKEIFRNMSAADRDALITFLKSL
ncbi:MAG: c-type cytochrome [Flavobacteriales bacterium]|nr:c-type cytochrome [Flavobacteriales bacterium]